MTILANGVRKTCRRITHPPERKRSFSEEINEKAGQAKTVGSPLVAESVEEIRKWEMGSMLIPVSPVVFLLRGKQRGAHDGVDGVTSVPASLCACEAGETIFKTKPIPRQQNFFW